ncbi:nuclease-related domain-containing DEAD/DEAH box helicase [Salisaeta longa]|uniref:nuclease-related domain-containing DEAD/DEAH box helicase n=1 Tax=Salisaeta longa TaxID=503170 RepID=UPI0003B2E3C1|nr:UvrD-helicase domain-containing protein [Salisaeta longa]
MAHCYPAPDDWNMLRTPLTTGERWLAETLIERLPDDWKIYLQPHVGGTRPDVVLVHPRAGVQVLEVKDYQMSAYKITADGWYVKDGTERHPIGDPVDQADGARRALFQTLLPPAGQAQSENTKLFGFARAGVFLTRASRKAIEGVRDRMYERHGSQARHYGLASRATLATDDLSTLIPILGYAVGTPSQHVRTIEDVFASIGIERPWHEVLHQQLHPTPDEVQQNRPLQLTPQQQAAARSTAHRLLITGPAGSGKTLVLARRAARALLREDATVLMLGFNITLWHYVRDMVARAVRGVVREGQVFTASERRAMGKAELRRRINDELAARYTRAMNGLMIIHYHRFAYNLLKSIGVNFDNEDEDERALHEYLLEPENAKNIRHAVEKGEIFGPYDVLLVDEGQDWGADWMRSLDPVLTDDVRVAMAADARQRIYGHAVNAAAEHFREAPTTHALEGTARVPPALHDALNAVAHTWPPPEGTAPVLTEAQQLALDFDDRPTPEAVWTVAAPDRLLDTAVAIARKHIHHGINPSQIAMLVDTHATGLVLEERLQTVNLDPCTVCVENPDEDKSRKHAFWSLDPRLKVCTVHSFKGWEADVVIVVLPAVPPAPRDRKRLHVALTRTRAVVEVVAPGPSLSDAVGSFVHEANGWTYRQDVELMPHLPPALCPPARRRRPPVGLRAVR